jgi:hypothetical protein
MLLCSTVKPLRVSLVEPVAYLRDSYFDYYLGSRTHLSLAKDAPTTRVVQRPEAGEIVEIPQVGGLHHRYERRAA